MNEETISYAEYAQQANTDGQLCPCQACVNDRLYYGPQGKQRTYTLIPLPVLGCYYTDKDSNPWSTFTLMGGTIACAACGKEIASGYIKGRIGEEEHFCGEHIQYQKEGE